MDLEELQRARRDPEAFWRDLPEGPVGKMLAIADLRAELEPALRRDGQVHWTDAVDVLKSVDSIEKLRRAKADPMKSHQSACGVLRVDISSGTSLA